MKRAVVYFSETNNTKDAAEFIAAELSADVVRIEMVEPLPKGKAGRMMMGGMQATLGKTPEIKGVPVDITEYDEIIIGTPVWAGKPASPIKSFYKNYKIASKVVGVFTFSAGGDNAKCVEALSRASKNIRTTVKLLDRHAKGADENEAKMREFVAEIG